MFSVVLVDLVQLWTRAPIGAWKPKDLFEPIVDMLFEKPEEKVEAREEEEKEEKDEKGEEDQKGEDENDQDTIASPSSRPVVLWSSYWIRRVAPLVSTSLANNVHVVQDFS